MPTPSTKQSGFALGTFSAGSGRAFPGLVHTGRVIGIAQLERHCLDIGLRLDGCETMLELLANWETNFHALLAVVNSAGNRPEFERAMKERGVPVDEVTWHAPVLPRQIFCCGANYRQHVIEYIVQTREGVPVEIKDDTEARRKWASELMDGRARNGRPYAFVKPVTAVNGPFDPIVLPEHVSKPDWELELAAVIGRPTYRVSRAAAMRHVAGFAVANDITARDQIFRRDEMAVMGTDWVAAKSAPGFLPLGPYLVPAQLIDDVGQLRLTLRLNGQVMQDEFASDMIFDVAQQVEYLSHLVQLLPGDVICTGSPAGNAMSHGHRYLRDGDVVEGTISGLGTQRNVCVRANS